MAALTQSKNLVKIVLFVLILLPIFYFFEFFSEDRVTVARVIDGDTVELRNGQKVRLLGIDTPEKGQYYHDEAMERLRELVERKKVILEKDVSNRDRYGRLLRYVYVDGLFVNLQMVKEGYAALFTTPKNVKYLNEFQKAENEAKEKGIGVWSLVNS